MEKSLYRSIDAGPTNAQIRKGARRLYAANFLRLLLVYGLSVAIARIPVHLASGLPTAWSVAADFLIAVLLYPIFTVGAAHMMLAVWDGAKPSFSHLFYCFFNRKLLGRALLYGLFFCSITILPRQFRVHAGGGAATVLSTLLSLSSSVFMVRAAVTPYMLAKEDTARLLPSVRYSLSRTKGKFWRYVGLALSVYWMQYLFILAAPAAVLIFRPTVLETEASSRMTFFWVAAVADVLLMPLIQLTLAGLLRTLLPAPNHFAFAENSDGDGDSANRNDAAQESCDNADIRWG